jgi:hypothetical protein
MRCRWIGLDAGGSGQWLPDLTCISGGLYDPDLAGAARRHWNRAHRGAAARPVGGVALVANATEYGLAAAVQSGSLQRAGAVAEQRHAGMVHVNDQTVNEEPPARLLPAKAGIPVRVTHRRSYRLPSIVHTVRTDADGWREDSVTAENGAPTTASAGRSRRASRATPNASRRSRGPAS